MRTLYFDLDGVLADFNKRCVELIGATFESFSDSKTAWSAFDDRKFTIYKDLEPMEDARILVDGVFELATKYELNIGVLTGIPKFGNVPLAKAHKKFWVMKHFPELTYDFNIGPWAEDKWKHCVAGDILIDDSALNIPQWNDAGGFGILHISASESLRVLSYHLTHK